MKKIIFLLLCSSKCLFSFIFEGTGVTDVYLHNIDNNRHIICSDPVFFDLKTNQLTCNSINPLFSKQVYYQDSQNEVFSDNLIIDFNNQNQNFSPSKILLIGHVKIKQKVENSLTFRYALADTLEYDLNFEEILLISNQGRNVLYFDETSDTHMKASKVRISHFKQSKRPKIEGLGDVSFTFKQDEIVKLEKSFKKNYER